MHFAVLTLAADIQFRQILQDCIGAGVQLMSLKQVVESLIEDYSHAHDYGGANSASLKT